jgi:hypothetical protein
MRFIFYLGGITAGLFTVFRIPHLSEACRDLFGPNDHDRFLATSFICITVIGLVLTGWCVKKTFPPPRTKSRQQD